ncbi:hypothetical protein LOTGIDRAFT_204654 [Lottia gigantea]|uniref:AB hydrolase-1 domain-containing protein n=1 Tax=Lottia gigantea TaxID=225164 RepID=V3Z397_LOTGI|nr:hypothetical protein LOTGIDRAFT_204654 [Lottia gigantea]ESO85093.1 hypothetical protein LOTGIDRAFT_204654 [Lottia gigantea]
MSLLIATGLFCVIYLLVKFLNISQPCHLPELYFKDKTSNFIQTVFTMCPILFESYIPPLLWGKSGHLQTFIYAKMGRIMSPLPNGKRIELIRPDNATMSFDVFQPHYEHPTGRDYTLAVCPGIANSSESLYIRTLVDHAQYNGFRVAVLNHLGALRKVKLTSPRIFNYGETGEYNCMIDELKRLYPNTSIIAVGCSMGANIVIKYLGECKQHENKVIGALSFCQGYDVNDAKPFLLGWESCRRLYCYFMAINLRQLLRSHQDILFTEQAQSEYGTVELKKLYSATSLLAIDELYSVNAFKFKCCEEYYHWASCKQYIQNITKPIFILNAEDDPIVPKQLYTTPLKYQENHDNCLFIVTKHGGHLGFFEGGFIKPNTITWLDRAVVQFSNVLCELDCKERKS